ncbi:MAG TPA: carboxypeptidase regulatory-like domain-containing protein [Bacteroidota bacterium]|nr:carboxypeptidase regulatory-like domain-containing protein [Bacteroidota bacterium]
MKRIGYALALALFFTGAAHAQLPPAPVDLDAKQTTQVPPGVELGWSVPKLLPPVPLNMFRVYRSVDDSTSFSVLNVTNLPAYDDRQVTAGHTYYYYVTWVWMLADSTVRESGKSNLAWVSVVPPVSDITGTINGTVTDSISGKPVPYARVTFYRRISAALWPPETIADSLGHYTAVIDTGNYLVLCSPPFLLGKLIMTPVAFPVYKPKWYKDAYDAAHATPVAVTDGGTFTADFALARFVFPSLVHVRGTVRDSAGAALKGATVVLTRTIQEMPQMAALGDPVVNLPGEALVVDGLGCLQGVAWKGLTDSAGAFDATVLSERSYIAMATAKGYTPQYYDHKATPLEATVIPVNGDVSGIDFNLNPYRPPQMYSISGIVDDSAGVRVPSRIIVFPLRSMKALPLRFVFTDSLGAYTVDHVEAGKYIVLAVPFGDYAPAFYKAGAFGVMSWKAADTVTVAANVTGIDIGVVQIHGSGVATLAGTVTSGGQPLEGVNVIAQDASGATLGYGMTDATGAYLIEALPAGSVTVIADLFGYDGEQQTIGVAPSQFSASQNFMLNVTTSVAPVSGAAPSSYALSQNYPNPFNPSTKISFTLPQAGVVTLRVFNLLGQQVATLVNGQLGAGLHEMTWDGRDDEGRGLASGVYFYRIHVSGPDGRAAYDAIRKMLLLK